MKLIGLTIGTRPEAVKMAPIVQAFQQSDWARPFIISTAQHREMLDEMFQRFNIYPDIDLNVMLPNQDLSELNANLLTALSTVLTSKFDAVLGVGDTTTVFVSALTCYYNSIPFGHIEAGLRSGNIYNPFPEEINRIFADRLATWLFAPTEACKQNLLQENIPSEKIYVTGNPVIDTLLSIPQGELSDSVSYTDSRRMILITAHRRESFGPPLANICEAIKTLADRFPETLFVYPVHLNPNVKETVYKILSGKDNIKLIAPVGYLKFVALMRESFFIMTDSGGVEEEAPALNIPILVLREITERNEIIDLGLAKLVGTNKEKIIAAATELLTDNTKYQSMRKGLSPYGDGHASERILAILKEHIVN